MDSSPDTEQGTITDQVIDYLISSSLPLAPDEISVPNIPSIHTLFVIQTETIETIYDSDGNFSPP